MTVQGSKLVTYLAFSNGAITPGTPAPYPTPSISAVLADGTTTLPGTFNASTGVFTIPDVPAGYYWLQNDGDYFWSNRSSVSLDWKQGGRKTTFWSATTSTATCISRWDGRSG
jgi:hypothetical protein